MGSSHTVQTEFCYADDAYFEERSSILERLHERMCKLGKPRLLEGKHPVWWHALCGLIKPGDKRILGDLESGLSDDHFPCLIQYGEDRETEVYAAGSCVLKISLGPGRENQWYSILSEVGGRRDIRECELDWSSD